MAWMMLRFQSFRCPNDTFFWASGQIASALQFVPLFLPALGIGFLAADGIAASIPGGQDIFNRPGKSGAGHAGERGQLIKFCLIALLLTLPISLGASLCQFCLTPGAVLDQPYPWTGFRDTRWDDVAAVTASCRYSSGRYSGWRKRYVLEMRDGAALDLMTWPAAAARAYPSIAEALHGQNFRFDSSGVAPGCPQPYLGMLSRPP